MVSLSHVWFLSLSLSLPGARMLNDTQAVVRLPASVVKALDALARKMTKESGVFVSRAAVIRKLVVEGLK